MVRDVVYLMDKELREHCHRKMLKTATVLLHSITSREYTPSGDPMVSQSQAKPRSSSDPSCRHGCKLRADLSVYTEGELLSTWESPRNSWSIRG